MIEFFLSAGKSVVGARQNTTMFVNMNPMLILASLAVTSTTVIALFLNDASLGTESHSPDMVRQEQRKF